MTYLPITKNIFKKIIAQPTKSLKDLNIDTIFKIIWAEFLYLCKIIYTISKLNKKSTFVETYTTKSNISFAVRDQYAMLRFKCSKTDIDLFKV